MSEQKWTYRDVEITIDKYARFDATVNGKFVTAGSFDGIKKKIDDLALFDAFPAWVSKYAAFRKVKIVGIVKSSYGRSWVDHEGGEHDSVLRDTPENRAAIKAREDFSKEEEKRKRAASERATEINEAIKWERVEK